MLSATFNETVTVRREASRNIKNEIVYAEVLDSVGGPVDVRCRIERRRRNARVVEGVEKTVDGRMLFRTDRNLPELKMHDLIFTKRNEVFEVVGIESDTVMFSGGGYGRVDLSFTRQPVTDDQHPAGSQ